MSTYTYNELHDWYTHLFKKVGWILLAHHQGVHEDKIKNYTDRVEQLKLAMLEYLNDEQIQKIIQKITQVNTFNDLII